jgi:flagellar basal body-associated protein FliL
MKKKLMILPVVLLVALGGAYKFVLAKPEPAPKPKVEGNVYILGKEFLVNLQGGRFAKLTAALVIDPKDAEATAAAGGAESAATPPEGFGTMPQEAVVRDIITNDLTGAKDTDLINRKGRIKMKEEILKDLNSHTDVKVKDVLFTDVTVQ